MIFSARSVTRTRFIALAILEKAQFALVVGDEHVLGLTVVVQHHLVRFPTDTRFFVTSEGGMCGVGVVTVHPDPSGLHLP